MLVVPYWLALKAEALHLADRTSEALEAIKEAEAFVERFEERWWSAELSGLYISMWSETVRLSVHSFSFLHGAGV